MTISKKILALIVALTMAALLITACAKETPAPEAEANGQVESDNSENEEDVSMTNLTMKINDEVVSVSWEDNESVAALRDLAAESPVVINTSAYGGFEQVGSIGTTLPSNDTSIKTKAGDIMLYTSDNIVVFYGSNSWSYTRLGHIENKSRQELADLLGGNNAVITITAE